MQVETLQDVLKWTQKFHHYLSDCMKHCTDKNESERSKLLLDYLSKHETHLEQLIASLCESASANALNTWCLEYVDKHPIVTHEKCQEPFSNMTTLDICDAVFEQHNQIIELYRYLYAQAGAPSALELISELIALEEHEAMQMSKGINQLEDL